MIRIGHESIAYDIASRAHQEQFYGDLPYIVHPVEAADLSKADAYVPELVSALYLHDTVEDTTVTLHELHELCIPDVVIWAVNCMTCNDTDPAIKVARAKQNPLSHRGKYYDSLANLRRSIEAYAVERIAKYQQNVGSLMVDFPNLDRLNRYIDDFAKPEAALLAQINEIEAHLPDMEWVTAAGLRLRVIELHQVLIDKASLESLLNVAA